MKQVGIQERLEQLTHEIRFIPERNKQLLLDWMENISIDWPISRRRWYHTEIPIWYTDDDKVLIVPPKGGYVRPWCEDPPEGSFAIDRETGILEQLRNLDIQNTLAKKRYLTLDGFFKFQSFCLRLLS